MTLLAILALTIPLSAQTVLFNNFGPGNTYQTDTTSAIAIGGSPDRGSAVSFTSPFSGYYTLNQIQFAGTFFAADPSAATSNGMNNLTVGLWVSSADLNSATQLETWTLSLPTPPSPTPQVFTLTSATSNTPLIVPVFVPGLNYFITETVALDGTSTAVWQWQQNNLMPAQAGYFSNINGGPWSAVADTTPVFSVSGDAIPTYTPDPTS